VSSPLVTVGIPFFNAKKWLLNAIRSVFAQSFSDWELILMNDGSTDGGVDLARSVVDPRVAVYSDGRNLKVTARRNQIVDLARGKYFAWLDADDMMHPERLRKQVEFLEADPAVDVVSTGMFILGPGGQVTGKRLPWAGTRPSCRSSEPCVVQGTVMGRTEWFRQNPQDPSLERAADMELWFRTALDSHFASMPEPLCFLSEMESFSPEKYMRTWRCLQEVIRRHGPRLVGRLNARREILKGYLKVAIYTGAYYCGLHEHILRRRSLTVSPEEKAEAAEILERIQRQELPCGRQ
jgi:glycosyltransferase involved in cell wall biosynthesis